MSSTTIPDQAARDAAVDPTRSVLVRAPAGSGKTGVLLVRFLRCLLTVSQPEHIIAITYTKKAAAEIRERIVLALAGAHEPASDPYDAQVKAIAADVLRHDEKHEWSILKNPSRLRISTFDSFCTSIAKRLPLLSGMGQISIEDDAHAVYSQAVMSLFRRMETSDEPLKSALSNVLAYANNRLEDLIPLLCTLLEKRDQWAADIVSGSTDEMEAALKEFVEGKAFDLGSQLSLLGFGDAVEIIRSQAHENEKLSWALDCPPYGETESWVPAYARCAQALLTYSGSAPSLRKPGGLNATAGFPAKQPNTVAMKEWLEVRQGDDDLTATLAEYAALPNPAIPEQARALIDDLRTVLIYLLAELHMTFESKGKVDFSEVAFRAISALDPPEYNDEFSLDVLLQEDRICHILVDEMQDTSVKQIRLLENLMQGWMPGDGRSVFLCGDLQQSIYYFRGALVGEFDRISRAREFGGRELEILQLKANFRSSPELVDWVNQAFTGMFGGAYVPALPQKPSGGTVSVHPYLGDAKQAQVAEAADVVELVKQYQETNPEFKIAILASARSQLKEIVRALKSAGIPFTGNKLDLLTESPVVQDFLALLKAWWHRGDDASWMIALRAPFVGLCWADCHTIAQTCETGALSRSVLTRPHTKLTAEGQARLDRLRSVWQQIERNPRSVDIRWAVPALWHSLGGPACIEEHDMININRVIDVLQSCAGSGILEDIAQFDRALSRLYAVTPPASVELMTVHTSKGLEFDVVILPGLGGNPSRNDSDLFYWRRVNESLLIAPRPVDEKDADSKKLYDFMRGQYKADERAEEARKLYVALTRAKRKLHLMGTAAIDSKTGDPKPATNTPLEKLWPLMAPEFNDAQSFDKQDQDDRMVAIVAPRISVDCSVRVHDALPRNEQEGTIFDRLAEQNRLAVLEDNIEERSIGIVYHELMRKIASMQGRFSVDDVDAMSDRIACRLRHHCHPEGGIEDSLQIVRTLCQNTLECEKGQWILSHYEVSGAEQALRRKLQDNWTKLIVDRFFVDGDCCWIIDYKTASGTSNAFFDKQRERYGAKMSQYCDAIREATGHSNIKGALYYPSSKTFIQI